MQLFTIGFTKKSAREFFNKMLQSGVKRVVDVRLNNVSQLAGFAKKKDLQYFLETIGPIDYAHFTDLAPTKKLLDDYKKRGGDWSVYEHGFMDLMRQRSVEEKFRGLLRDGDCLLCSEEKQEHCHRRLVAEYLREKWTDLEIVHIV